jgi:ribulose-phosphate 3-epimerase
MNEILPSILTEDAETFRERLLFPGFWQSGMTAHIDILDGSMFGTTCFRDPAAVAANGALSDTQSSILHFPSSIELHLMVRNPLPVIERWKMLVPQTVRAIVHAEIDRPLNKLFHQVHGLGLEFGMAFCPETSTDLVGTLSGLPDRALIMGINPGASGRPFIGEPILSKIQRLRTQHPSLHISVDGGVTKQNAESICTAGASSLVAASAIWATPHPRESYEHLVHRTALHG